MQLNGVWSEKWAHPKNSQIARDIQATVNQCSALLVQPTNTNARMGLALRCYRLRTELLEFSYRYRLATSRAPTQTLLVEFAEVLIRAVGPGLAIDPLPVDKELFVNSETMPLLLPPFDKAREGELRAALRAEGSRG